MSNFPMLNPEESQYLKDLMDELEPKLRPASGYVTKQISKL